MRPFSNAITLTFALALSATSSMQAQFTETVTSLATAPLMFTVTSDATRVLGVDVNGDTWAWSSSTGSWSLTGAPTNTQVLGQTLVNRNGTAFAYSGGSNPALTFVGNAWTPVTLTGSPTAIFGGGALAALPNGDVLMFGGSLAGGTSTDETWRLSGTTWTQVITANAPSPRRDAAVAVDSNGNVVLFGGSNNTGVLGETWVFDGTDWTQLSLPVEPTPRTQAAMIARPISGGITLVGGTPSVIMPSTPVTDAWTFRNNTWQTIPTNYGGFGTAVYGAGLDPVSNEIVASPIALPTTIVGTLSGFTNVGIGCFCSDTQPRAFNLVGGGTPALGQTFTVGFRNYEVGNPIFLAFDSGLLPGPVQIPILPAGCTTQLTPGAGSVLAIANPPAAPQPSFAVPVPNTTNLVGLSLFYQGLQLNFPGFAGCSSDTLNTIVSR